MIKKMVGAKLSYCRAKWNLSQKQVADSVGVSQPTYSRFESGRYECSYEQMHRLCDFFEVSTDWLLGIEDLKQSVR